MSGVWSGGRGSSRKWRNLRALIIERDADIAVREGRVNCALRIPGVCSGNSGPRHVHHVHGSSADIWDPRTLETTCVPCNLATGDPRKQKPTTPEVEPPAWLAEMTDPGEGD